MIKFKEEIKYVLIIHKPLVTTLKKHKINGLQIDNNYSILLFLWIF